MTTTIIRALAVSGLAAIGSLIGLASPASADPVAGNYTGTILDSEQYTQGDTAPFTVNTCGQDCVLVVQTGRGWELQRQGNTWTETDARGTATLDEGTLILTVDSVQNGHMVIGLVKNA